MKTDALRPGFAEISRYRVRLLGSFAVERVADGLDCTPRGRKARALLAFLSLTRVPADRDRLAALLWSERGEAQAHASLRQSLLELKVFTRSERPLLIAERRRVGLANDLFDTDVDRIEALAAAGDAAGVAALMPASEAGLLADSEGIDPAFDEWLLPERAARTDRLIRAVTGCGEAALEQGDLEGARAVAERLGVLDPGNEAAARLAMAAADGDFDAVRRAYARIEASLARDLDVEPSPATAAVYRRLMAARPAETEGEITEQVDALAESLAAPVAPSARTRAKPKLRPLRVAAAIFALAGAAVGVTVVQRNQAAAAETVVKVDPFEIARGDRSASDFGRELSAALSRFANVSRRGFAVVEPGSNVAASAPDYLVRVSIRSGGGQLAAQARLLSAEDGGIVWSRDFQGPTEASAALRDQMAVQIADVMTCSIEVSESSERRFDRETMRLIFSACGEWRGNDKGRIVGLFQDVVEREPGFAAGWAWMAVVQGFESQAIPDDRDELRLEARRNARRALALDPNSGPAYMALVSSTHEDAPFAERFALIDKGRSVDPDNGELWFHAGWWLLAVGRLDEAAVAAQRAAAIDPMSPSKRSGLIQILALTGDFNPARALLDEGQRLWPDRMDMARLVVAIDSGDTAGALAMLDSNPRMRDRLGWSAALMKDRLAARLDPSPANLRRLEAAVQDALANHSKAAGWAASIFAEQGRVDEAFALLDRARRRDWETAGLFEASAAPLRRDPRFMRIALKRGLVDYWSQSGKWPDFCSEPGLPYDCKAEAARLRRAAVPRLAKAV